MQDSRIQRDEIVGAIEAVVFAAGDPVTFGDLKKIFARLWAAEPELEREALLAELRPALDALKARWQSGADPASSERGFALAEVAEGLTFRSNPRFADAVRAMREQRPVRLSRPALECLSIVAYRQPVTKPEVDDIRGVDCGGTLRTLLERNLVRIVGKREEPGRPLLYGTTKEFLSFFNLDNLAQLPTLRDVQELGEEAQEELAAFDGVSLKDLSDSAKKLRLDEEPAVAVLNDAVKNLVSTEVATRDALAAEGIQVDGQQDADGDGAVEVAEPSQAPETPEPPES